MFRPCKVLESCLLTLPPSSVPSPTFWNVLCGLRLAHLFMFPLPRLPFSSFLDWQNSALKTQIICHLFHQTLSIFVFMQGSFWTSHINQVGTCLQTHLCLLYTHNVGSASPPGLTPHQGSPISVYSGWTGTPGSVADSHPDPLEKDSRWWLDRWVKDGCGETGEQIVNGWTGDWMGGWKTDGRMTDGWTMARRWLVGDEEELSVSSSLCCSTKF